MQLGRTTKQFSYVSTLQEGHVEQQESFHAPFLRVIADDIPRLLDLLGAESSIQGMGCTMFDLSGFVSLQPFRAQHRKPLLGQRDEGSPPFPPHPPLPLSLPPPLPPSLSLHTPFSPLSRPHIALSLPRLRWAAAPASARTSSSVSDSPAAAAAPPSPTPCALPLLRVERPISRVQAR